MMQRRFSSLLKNSTLATHDESDNGADTESKISTIQAQDEPLPIPSLKIKRVDYYYSRWSKSWKYRNMSSGITVESIPILQSGSNDPWKDYAFVIVRKLSQPQTIFRIVVKSEYLLKACKDVIQTWPGISWNTDPLELEPEMFLTFMPKFAEYRDAIAAKKQKSEVDRHIHSTVNLLLSSLTTDYRFTISKIENLLSHSEITFEYLYAILVPRTLFVTSCAITGQPRLFKLMSAQRTRVGTKSAYRLACESVDLVDNGPANGVGVGRVQTMFLIRSFKGTVKIQSLDAYPIIYHPDEANLHRMLLRRGKKWVDLIGIHHKQFDGTAALNNGNSLTKQNVKGRIMIDRATFHRLNPDYQLPILVQTQAEIDMQNTRLGQHDYPPCGLMPPSPPLPPPVPIVPGTYANGTLVKTQNGDTDVKSLELTDDDLILTSTVVFGFSLSDKMWLEFDVEKIEDIEWNDDAFANLVLPSGRKQLLESLVEAHHKELGFDDFIKGKGHGLIINLFGPPGVGKTFSAEATSEHVRRPLYLISGGDLGTKAADLDTTLARIFDVATAWKAIVLIDEADVFLEQRSLHDLERNAMVAVFLRHVEYYRGILFLTTNRVQAFDEAFLSRIHVALHFHELTQSSKEQVWAAFIAKLGVMADVTQEQIRELAKRGVNGRQIKNAARTAQSLAVSQGEKVGFRHFVETLDALAEFQKDFEELKVGKEGL